MDVKKLNFSFGKKSLAKETSIKRKTEVNSDFSVGLLIKVTKKLN